MFAQGRCPRSLSAASVITITFATLSLSVSTVAAKPKEWRPTAADVAELESRLVLPVGASAPLQDYRRYYAGVFESDDRIIEAELIEAKGIHTRVKGATIVPRRKFPGNLFDAGCGVIWFTYNPRSRVFRNLACQPELKAPPPLPD